MMPDRSDGSGIGGRSGAGTVGGLSSPALPVTVKPAKAASSSGAGVATFQLVCTAVGVAVPAPPMQLSPNQVVEVWPMASNKGNVTTAHDPSQAVSGPFGTYQAPGSAMQSISGLNNLCEIWAAAQTAGDGVLLRVARL
jgi:hypothetical protein